MDRDRALKVIEIKILQYTVLKCVFLVIRVMQNKKLMVLVRVRPTNAMQ